MFLLAYCTVSLVQCGLVLKQTTDDDNVVPTDLHCSGLPLDDNGLVGAHVAESAPATLTVKNDARRRATRRVSPRGMPSASDVAKIVSQIRSRVVAVSERETGSTARPANDREATGWPPTSLIDAIVETLNRGIGADNGDGEECVEQIVSLVREALQARRNVQYENNTTTTKCPSTTTTTTNATTTYYTPYTSKTTTRKGTGSTTTKATVTSTAFTSEPMEMTDFGFENIQPNLADLVNGYVV